MTVPFHFTGEDVASGVKTGGGVIQHHENDIEISVLPKDLPEYIEVDLSALGLDESIHLSQIKLPKGVELVGIGEGEDPSLVSIHLPRVIEEPEDDAPEAGEVPVGDEEIGDEETKDEGGED